MKRTTTLLLTMALMRRTKLRKGLVAAAAGFVTFWAAAAAAQPFPGGLPECNQTAQDCQTNLAECDQDVEECEAELGEASLFPATGQDRTVVAGEDGNPAFGAPLSYRDNLDGTVTDNNTGLMWEQKTDDGSLHDRLNHYPWSSFCNVAGDGSGSGAECGTDADCATAGETCNASDGSERTTIFEWVAMLNTENRAGFAGHNDWRIPNVKELQSIVDYGEGSPSIDPTFGNTISEEYWSATAGVDDPSRGWSVHFRNGSVFNFNKTFSRSVRAVRGGS